MPNQIHNQIRNEALVSEARSYKAELLENLFGVSALAAASGKGTQGALALSVLPQGSNIVGVGYGAKITSGAGVEGDLAVRVYVRAKVSESSLPASEKVPKSVNGKATDVITVGDVTTFARPTECGVSVGHFAITAGTLGCLVRRRVPSINDHFILSNNHVLANTNAGVPGDDILEPGPTDGGNPADPIAQLTDFEPIDFFGANSMDAAIARVLNIGDVNPEILGNIGPVAQPPAPASLYESVRKHGRTTRHTIGVIMDLAADINVRYGTRLAAFEDQIAITGVGGAFSDGGDSGSCIVDAVQRKPVALLFAGGLGTTFANPIIPVLDRFQVDIV